MKGDKETEPGYPAPVEIDCDQARLIGEIVAEAVAALGQRRAMLPDAIVQFGPTAGELTVGPSARGGRGSHAGCPENSASVQPHSARSHFRQRGIRSR